MKLGIFSLFSFQMHFNSTRDLLLLREVASQHVFSDETPEEVWQDIAATLLPIYQATRPGLQNLTDRTCRDRTLRLIRIFRSEDAEQLKKLVML